MRKIYLSIGSNKGNRYSFIKEALRLIQKDIGEVILISKIYETKSWGFQSDDFLNLCILIKSKLTPTKLISKLKKIEKEIMIRLKQGRLILIYYFIRMKLLIRKI